MRQMKPHYEIKVGDWIWWDKSWTQRPVLDAFFSDATMSKKRLVEVKTIKIYTDRLDRPFIVYEIDFSEQLPAPYQACQVADGTVRILPIESFKQESLPAHYLDEDDWQINVESGPSPYCST